MVPSSKLRLDLEDRKQFCGKNKGLLDTSCFLLELTVLRLDQLVIQRQYIGEACIICIAYPMCGFNVAVTLAAM